MSQNPPQETAGELGYNCKYALNMIADLPSVGVIVGGNATHTSEYDQCTHRYTDATM